MAINKAQSPAWVKVVVWLIIAAFVLTGVGFGGSAILKALANATQGGQATDQAQTSTDSLEVINAMFQPTMASLEASAAADPENLDLLTRTASTYMDWAYQLYNSTDVNAQGAFATTMAKAVPYWERAKALSPSDRAIAGDLATALFYSGNTADAIALAEETLAANPDYATVWFNLGIFKESAGDTAGAKTAYENAIAKDTDGSVKTAAQSALDALGK